MQYFDFTAYQADNAHAQQPETFLVTTTSDSSTGLEVAADARHSQCHYKSSNFGRLRFDHARPQPRLPTSTDDNSRSQEYDDSASDAMTPDDITFLGMTGNDLQDDLLLIAELVPPVPDDIKEALQHPSELSSLDRLVNSETLRGHEKWNVDKESAEYLASVMALAENTPPCTLRAGFWDLKQEEAILRTDPEMDMIHLFERNTLHLTTDGIKPISLDDENDESLSWPQSSLKLPTDINEHIAQEKLIVEGETAEYLKNIVQGPDFDLKTWIANDRQGRAPIRHLSPTVLPLSPPFEAEIMSSPAARIDLTSDAEDPSTREAVGLEQELFQLNDVKMQEAAESISVDCNSSIKYSPLSLPGPSSSSPLQRKTKKIYELKIASPITPNESSEPPTKKTKVVSFDDDVNAFIPQPEVYDPSTDVEDIVNEAMSSINGMIEPLAQDAIQRSANERLVGADTTLKIAVPEIDNLRPRLSWNWWHPESGEGHDSQRSLLTETRDEITAKEKRWTGVSKIEGTLPWSPFPSHLGTVKPEGDFDDGSLMRYLAELDLEGDVNLKTFTWKPDGLRLLDFDEEDNDEVKPGAPEEHEIDQNIISDVAQIPSNLRHTPQCPVPSVLAPTDDVPESQLSLNSEPLKQKANSIEALLRARKLQLEAQKKDNEAKARSSTDMLNQSNISLYGRLRGWPESPKRDLPMNAALANLSTLSSTHEIKLHESKSVEKSQTQPIPTPTLLPTTAPLRIIVSSHLMQNYHLIRALQAHLPTLEITERSTASQTHPPALEADLTLSPSTGLLLTTLAKLSQKPLPGTNPQPSTTGPQQHPQQRAAYLSPTARITQISARYETLLILITDNTSRQLPSSPATIASPALQNLISTTSLLPTDVRIVYVPGGSPADLSAWIAAAITRYSAMAEEEEEGFGLAPDESRWERFLRQAGFNAFAAQAVLSGDGGGRLGLAEFVMMSGEERIERFGAMMGGTRVLGRVNALLATRWQGVAGM